MTEVTARNFRVSDAEREHVVDLLQKAIGRGLLDLDEFTSRTDTALAASTRGELNAVLVDLPGMVHRDAAPSTYRMPAVVPGGAEDRVVLNGKYSTIVRSGRWAVPREIVVRNKYGNTKLDFTGARFAHPVVQVELGSKWGSVEIIIPETASVSTDSISEVKWGSVKDKTSSNGKPGNPHIVLTGRLHGGSLTIRHRRMSWLGS
ncbi:MAG: DUF1707 domain-containing protein [Pseudonocardiaceae bacterium]|nr:DUF1707 domain-containing protein [Pseudonocardiaceae bacterium]